MDSDFERAAQERIASLNRRIEELAEREAELRAERSQVSAELEDVQGALEVYRDIMGISPPSAGSTIPMMSPGDGIPKGTIADMCAAYIRQHGPTDVGELVEFLATRDKFKAGGHPRGRYGTVFGTLKRDSRFVKTPGRGRFSLANQG